MRCKGRITEWRDDRGFGFITPARGGDRVFVHVKSFARRSKRPAGNEIVTYVLEHDAKGRPRAARVAFSGVQAVQAAKPSKSRRGAGPLVLATLFIAALAEATAVGALSPYILGLYLAGSAITFFAYAWDKWAATNNRWRTAESTLHLLGLLGGWPGAIYAQQMFRHKSRKRSFQVVFWGTVILNCGALAWFLARAEQIWPST